MIKKQKILVLSDLNKSTINTIKSSVSIAKIVNADINFFYIKRPVEVVKKESQLSAIRTINQECFSIDKTIKSLLEPISKDYNVNIEHTFKIGNLKDELALYIEENKPDIIILGKRKTKIVNFWGDNLTKFILKKHKGTIIIADDSNPLEPNKELSLGMFNITNIKGNTIESFVNASEKPLISFNVLENSQEETISNDKKTIEYIFEKGDNAIKNISNSLTKSNVNLLFVKRDLDKKNKSNIKDAIKNFNCSLILTT
jgi:hypothetical protein